MYFYEWLSLVFFVYFMRTFKLDFIAFICMQYLFFAFLKNSGTKLISSLCFWTLITQAQGMKRRCSRPHWAVWRWSEGLVKLLQGPPPFRYRYHFEIMPDSFISTKDWQTKLYFEVSHKNLIFFTVECQILMVVVELWNNKYIKS